MAKQALAQLLAPLAGFVSDTGLSAGEFESLFRAAVVRTAAQKQLTASDRVNISGIAATTGISRAHVSRLLRGPVEAGDALDDAHDPSTHRILAGWHVDPTFAAPSGGPADLVLYGPGATFETLAKKYGGGLPTRAVLDELARAGAIELLASQKIRAKAVTSAHAGIEAGSVAAFGERATELLSTLLQNLRQPAAPTFVASRSATVVSARRVPSLRRELAVKGFDFHTDVQQSESHADTPRGKRKRTVRRVSVTVFCHESPTETSTPHSVSKRRNFKRES